MLIYENNDLVAINKPNGLASQGGANINQHVDKIVNNHLKMENRRKKGYLLHRLDQYASGVMVLGKNIHYARTFSGLMADKRINKSYVALGQGIPNYLFDQSVPIDINDPERFLSGLIRSDNDCLVYDHNLVNPKISIMSDQMKYLFTECQKLDMFKDTPEFSLIDEIAEKK